jgi:hypothetical protein
METPRHNEELTRTVVEELADTLERTADGLTAALATAPHGEIPHTLLSVLAELDGLTAKVSRLRARPAEGTPFGDPLSVPCPACLCRAWAPCDGVGLWLGFVGQDVPPAHLNRILSARAVSRGFAAVLETV